MKRKILVLGDKNYKQITEDICSIPESLPGKGWVAFFIPANLLLVLYVVTIGVIIGVGMGLMGVNHPVGWGTDIVTFVFWVGIGHAGTLISAILFYSDKSGEQVLIEQLRL